MIKAGQIEKGSALLIKGQPYLVIEREFVNPGKGSAFVRLKLKSPATGQTLQETMKSQDNAEDLTHFFHFRILLNFFCVFHSVNEFHIKSYHDLPQNATGIS